MSKVFCIVTGDGVEILDPTPEAEERISAMDFLEERWKNMQERRKRKQKRRSFKPSRSAKNRIRV